MGEEIRVVSSEDLPEIRSSLSDWDVSGFRTRFLEDMGCLLRELAQNGDAEYFGTKLMGIGEMIQHVALELQELIEEYDRKRDD